jgi:hypothetical protein
MNTPFFATVSFLALALSASACPETDAPAAPASGNSLFGRAHVGLTTPTVSLAMLKDVRDVDERDMVVRAYAGSGQGSSKAPMAVRVNKSVRQMFVMKDGTNTYKITLADGKIESSTVNDQPLPEDRVNLSAEKLTIKNADGSVLGEFKIVSDANKNNIGGGAGGGAGGGSGGGAGLGSSPFGRAVVPAKSMVGITLVEADDVLAGHLGLKGDEVTMVSGISVGLAADKAGLKPYDIIVAVDGKTPATPESIRKAIRAAEPGAVIKLRVVQKGAERELSLTTEAFDSDKLAAAEITSMPEAKHSIASANGTGNNWGGMVLPPGITLNRESIEALRGNADQPRKMAEDFHGNASELRRQAEEMAKAAREHKSFIWTVPGQNNENMGDMQRQMEELRQQIEQLKSMLRDLKPAKPEAHEQPKP